MIRALHVQKVTGVAGSERHLLTLLPRMTRARFRPTMLVLEEADRPAEAFVSEMRASGIETLVLPLASNADVRCWRRVRRIIAGGGFDILHTHLIHGDFYGLSAAMTCRRAPRCVSTKHGYDNYDRTSRWYRLGRWFGARLDAIVTISDALQAKVEAAEGLPRRKMQTIHYGIEFGPSRERRPSQGAFRLVSVGRLVPVKGFDVLVAAMARLSQGREVSLTIVGDGPERERLAAQADRLGVANRIHFAGWQRDVRNFLDDADVFVLPTLGEGFGLAILEAMGAGLPVIASDTMAIPEIVLDGKTGRLVPPKDPDALARAIEALRDDPIGCLSLGVAGRQRAIDEFSVDRMVRRHEMLYESLVQPDLADKRTVIGAER